MCTMAGFLPPSPPGHVTVGERYGKLESVLAFEENAALAVQGIDYVTVHISGETFRPSLSRETARSAFVEDNETLTKRLIHAWYEHGLHGVFEELANQNDLNGLARLADIPLHVVRWLSSFHCSILPHHSMTRSEMIQEFSACSHWSTSSIRAIAWHPHTDKLAVCLRDDSVRVYRNKHDIIPVLKHRQQKQVSQLAWRPYSTSVLAVACGSCIVVWNVDPASLSTRPSSSLAQVLTHPGHCPVTNVAWSPCSAMLVSSSPADTAIMAWDLSTELCIPLRRLGGGGVTSLVFSPDGCKLFSATPGTMFRVWDCATWECERWTRLNGRCKASCWSPCGRVLLFATSEDFTIYSLAFPPSGATDSPDCGGAGGGAGGGVGGSNVAMACVNVQPCHVGDYRVGGYVHSMCWDPTGERLAVIFTDPEEEETCRFVALYQTRLNPVLEILPCGLISGHADELPDMISFLPNFKHGALLTIVWSSGRLGYVPLWFVSSRDANWSIPVQHVLPSNGAATLYSTTRHSPVRL